MLRRDPSSMRVGSVHSGSVFVDALSGSLLIGSLSGGALRVISLSLCFSFNLSRQIEENRNWTPTAQRLLFENSPDEEFHYSLSLSFSHLFTILFY